ncbi:MAG: hypothetical protein ACLP9L_24770 [Thermoguttaceae bacterium]
MKRCMVLLFSCLAIAGSAWLARVVWGQAAETKERTFTITQSQLDEHVAKKVAKAVADEREKSAHDRLVTDEQVLNPQNWHIAVVDHAQYVVYTGPGMPIFHHWVEPAAKPSAARSGAAKGGPAKGAATTTPASKGN